MNFLQMSLKKAISANCIHWMPVALKVQRPVFTEFTVRTLYSSSALKIVDFLNQRTKLQASFGDTDVTFKKQMTHIVNGPATRDNMVLTIDVKKLVHLAENTSEDISLTIKILRKFSAQTHSLNLCPSYGPVVMHLFHHFKLDEEALQCFNDPGLKGFFTQYNAQIVLLDLLYRRNRYQELLDTFEIIKAQTNAKKQILSRHLINLAFAAAYKLNTPEAFKYSLNLLNELHGKQAILDMRTYTFLAGLALAQNYPHIALDTLAHVKNQQNYVTVRNMKALALLRMRRYEDAIELFRSALENSESTLEKREMFTQEVMDTIRTVEQGSGSKENVVRFQRIEKFLEDNGQLSDESLDSLLCAQYQKQPGRVSGMNFQR